jgi:hypothetical protein
MTKIVCKLQRKGGTKVENLFGKTYHFKPEKLADKDSVDPEIAHVCDIPNEDAAAIHRLLQITSAYVLASDDEVVPAKPKADPGQTIGNEKVDPKKAAPVIIKNSDGEEIDLTTLDPEQLRILARDTFQIKVHHKWPDTTVIAKIVEATRGES